MTPSQMFTEAGKNYGKCCKAVNASAADANHPSAIESERLIGFGIANDWVRRAGAMKELQYEGRLLNRSNRAPGVTELIRFNLAWSGMNALFCRQSIRSLLSTSPATSEIDRLKILVAHANLPSQDVTAAVSSLHKILDTHIITRILETPPGTPVITLAALHYKYTPQEVRSKGVSKKVEQALATGSLAQLDLPTIIYLMRNWGIHGALIDSNFRSVARFRSFIGNILGVRTRAL